MSAVGTLQGRFALVRFGKGPAPLVVLPGLVFDNPAPRVADARLYGWAMHRLAVGRTVTILKRPRGIAPTAGHELGTEDLADLYAGVLADEPVPVDIMGLSTEG